MLGRLLIRVKNVLLPPVYVNMSHVGRGGHIRCIVKVLLLLLVFRISNRVIKKSENYVN